jgi:hypothetical protein
MDSELKTEDYLQENIEIEEVRSVQRVYWTKLNRSTIMDKRNCSACISYYQILRGWHVPYGATVRLLEAGLNSLDLCTTATGARGITESYFNLLRDTFRIRHTITGRWELVPTSQQTLPGF